MNKNKSIPIVCHGRLALSVKNIGHQKLNVWWLPRGSNWDLLHNAPCFPYAMMKLIFFYFSKARENSKRKKSIENSCLGQLVKIYLILGVFSRPLYVPIQKMLSSGPCELWLKFWRLDKKGCSGSLICAESCSYILYFLLKCRVEFSHYTW